MTARKNGKISTKYESYFYLILIIWSGDDEIRRLLLDQARNMSPRDNVVRYHLKGREDEFTEDTDYRYIWGTGSSFWFLDLKYDFKECFI